MELASLIRRTASGIIDEQTSSQTDLTTSSSSLSGRYLRLIVGLLLYSHATNHSTKRPTKDH